MMTREEIMKKLEEIKRMGNNNADGNEAVVSRSDEQGDTALVECEQLGPECGDVGTVSDSDGVGSSENSMEVQPVPVSQELRELARKWGGTVGITGKIVENSVSMARKDYLKYTKGLNQDQVLADPLLYVLFRSDEQSEVNFFSWLEKFPKAKDESGKQEQV